MFVERIAMMDLIKNRAAKKIHNNKTETLSKLHYHQHLRGNIALISVLPPNNDIL